MGRLLWNITGVASSLASYVVAGLKYCSQDGGKLLRDLQYNLNHATRMRDQELQAAWWLRSWHSDSGLRRIGHGKQQFMIEVCA